MRSIFVAACMCVILSLAGCSGKGAEAPSAKPGEAAAGSGQLQVAVIPKGLSHQFWLTVKAGAEAAAKEGNAQVVWQGPAKETEVEKQINIIEDMVSSKVSAIVMAACDETALIRPVENAIAAGIPVVTVDSGIKSDIPVSLVATDNAAGAKLAAKELARLIGGEGEVGLIPFVKGAATSEMREQGFKDGLAELPGLKLVATLYSQSDAALAMNITQDMLTSNPNIKGIFATNEPSAIGAAQAIKAAGKTGAVKLVAFDASTQELSALNEGAIQALVVQNPFKMGYEGVKAALDHIQGKQVAKRIDTGVTIITSENINTPEVQKLLNPI